MALAHEKVGHTGQGLWHDKHRQLPAYIQHIANDLIQQRGMDESRAIATAISICKKWAAGGKDVHPDTRAKAAAAIAEWERLKAGTHMKRGSTLDMSAAEEILRSWDPGKHPRAAAGSAAGGQFAPASSSSSGAKGKDTRATPSNAHPVGEGEKGQRVSDLQKRLNALGAHLAVDGIFGPKTLAAVRAFQKAHGLKVDGLVGPKTTAALRTGKHDTGKTAAKHTAGKTPGEKASTKPHSITTEQKNQVSQLLKTRKVPAADAADMRQGLAAMPAADAQALIKHLQSLPARRAETTRSTAIMSIAARAGNKPYGDVKYADPKNGKYPIDTAERARAAWGYINKADNAAQYPMNGVTLKEVKERIMAACKKFGIEVASDNSNASRAMMRAEIVRDVPLEDYHIVRMGEGDSSGRVVEAYMTVFSEPTEIRDHQGHYREDIDRSAFNKRIADLERSSTGFAAAKVFYNHGMTIHGSPSDRYSMPVAVCESIRIDSRGPITRSRYLDTPLGNEVLEMWRSGAITAQSFTGAIIRSSPELRRGERYQPRNGRLPVVRRLELGLKEYGPTPFPAYQGAELVGVRMSPLGTWQAADDDEDLEDLDRFEVDDEVALPDEEAAAGGPPEVHPTRDHAHRLYALRTEQMLRETGIAPLNRGW